MEIKVEPAAEFPLADLATIEFSADYPEASPIFRMNAEIQVEPGQQPAVNTRQDGAGFAYRQVENKRNIQVAPDSFTFIWIGDYTTWEDFTEQAESAWAKYREVIGPARVHSIGVRFINVIKLPAKAVEIKDYLRISIDIPSALPQMVGNLFTQVDIPMAEFGVFSTITTSIVNTDDTDNGGLLLDIDVRAPVEIDTLDRGFDREIRAKLDSLRMAKNLVFEACITDATRERID